MPPKQFIAALIADKANFHIDKGGKIRHRSKKEVAKEAGGHDGSELMACPVVAIANTNTSVFTNMTFAEAGEMLGLPYQFVIELVRAADNRRYYLSVTAQNRTDIFRAFLIRVMGLKQE